MGGHFDSSRVAIDHPNVQTVQGVYTSCGGCVAGTRRDLRADIGCWARRADAGGLNSGRGTCAGAHLPDEHVLTRTWSRRCHRTVGAAHLRYDEFKNKGNSRRARRERREDFRALCALSSLSVNFP